MRAVIPPLIGLTLLILLSTPDPGLAAQDDPRLDGLFERLAATASAAEAGEITAEIWRLWNRHGDEEVDAIMAHGISAMNTGNMPRALRAFDVVVNLAPEFAEGWNKRATVNYLMGDYPASVEDIERTLALEPRHFGALSGLGLVSLEMGNDAAALAAFKEALAINPHMKQTRARIEELRARIEGKRI